MQSEKVSIIIATYNSSATLAACLKSVLDQSYKNIEVCLIDGASTDGTLPMIRDAASNNSQIKYISEKDNGVFYALNKGITISTGSWLYFLGSDDELSSPTILAEIFSEPIDPDIALIYGSIAGLHTGKKYSSITDQEVITKGISHQSVFYKRNIFDELGKYDLTFKIAADYCLTLRVFLNEKYKTLYCDKVIALFGERGLSSNQYDYTFYSYYYKLLAQNSGIGYLADPKEYLDKSIYCCLHLGHKKQDVLFAWKNLMYYLLQSNHLSFYNRIKTFFTMLKWSLT